MDTSLADALSRDVWTLGQAFYFTEATKAAGETLGLNVVEFYGLGRGGVLGPVDLDELEAAFVFFPRATLGYFWARAGEVDVLEVAAAHVAAADAFAEEAFAQVDGAALAAVAEATEAVAAAVAPGRYALYDGYRAMARPEGAPARAYRGLIELRELRGGVHIEAVVEAGLSPAEAAYLDDEGIFRLHGYGDADIPEVTEELRERRAQAEARTSQMIEAYLGTLSAEQREGLAAGVLAMRAALG